MKKYRILTALIACILALPAIADAAYYQGANTWNVKKNIASKTLVATAIRNAQGGRKVITISHLPQTLAEFKAMPQMDLRKPENTVVMFLCAANLWTIDKASGEDAINLLSNPKRQMTNFDKQFLRDRLGDKHYLPRSYFEGASPDNNYTPSQPLSVRILPDGRPQDVEAGYKRLFLKSGGADSNRYIKLREKDGIWYLWEYFGLLPGIRLPKAEADW